MAGFVPSAQQPAPQRITRSRLHCLDCDAVIESKHRHDFVSCPCGNAFLDGGREYVRYGYIDAARVVLLTEYES